MFKILEAIIDLSTNLVNDPKLDLYRIFFHLENRFLGTQWKYNDGDWYFEGSVWTQLISPFKETVFWALCAGLSSNSRRGQMSYMVGRGF